MKFAALAGRYDILNVQLSAGPAWLANDALVQSLDTCFKLENPNNFYLESKGAEGSKFA